MRLEELWGQIVCPSFSQGKSEAPVVTGVSPVLRKECRRHGGYYRRRRKDGDEVCLRKFVGQAPSPLRGEGWGEGGSGEGRGNPEGNRLVVNQKRKKKDRSGENVARLE